MDKLNGGVNIFGNKICVKADEFNFNMTIDGVSIKGVTAFEYLTSVDELPLIRMEFTPSKIELDINGEMEED